MVYVFVKWLLTPLISTNLILHSQQPATTRNNVAKLPLTLLHHVRGQTRGGSFGTPPPLSPYSTHDCTGVHSPRLYRVTGRIPAGSERLSMRRHGHDPGEPSRTRQRGIRARFPRQPFRKAPNSTAMAHKGQSATSAGVSCVTGDYRRFARG